MARNDSKTTQIGFGRSPAQALDVFSVNAGCDVGLANLEAGALEESIKHLLEQAVLDGMSSQTAFLCSFGLEAAGALRRASECAVRGERA